MNRALNLCFFLAALPSQANATATNKLVTKVQRTYQKLRTFEADFAQSYTSKTRNKTIAAQGHVFLMKPGKMRWDFLKPNPKTIIADGKRLVIYEPEEQQATIQENFRGNQLSSSLKFLWGEGDLKTDFQIKIGPVDKYPVDKKRAVLVLTPKKDATFEKLVLAVDRATGQVGETILFETSGNTNHFVFANSRVNKPIRKERFVFKTPPGVEEVQL